ncbi:MAG: hypothetical protein AAGA97_02615 [Pseudomonadota bacterium]
MEKCYDILLVREESYTGTVFAQTEREAENKALALYEDGDTQLDLVEANTHCKAAERQCPDDEGDSA